MAGQTKRLQHPVTDIEDTTMDDETSARLEQKTPEQSLYREFVDEFGLAPVIAEALVRRFQTYSESLNQDHHEPGQITYHAVDADEPPGKSLSEMQTTAVTLTLFDESDLDVLEKHGMQALRRVRIQRLLDQAHEQHALLTQEDLVVLLCSSERTIRRDIAALREEGIACPTRGQQTDIGPGQSHKAQIVELWLTGYQISEIETKTQHALSSIERYLTDFSRVLVLSEDGYSVTDIRQITGLSERLVREYRELRADHHKADHESARLVEARHRAPTTDQEVTDQVKKRRSNQ
jgi:hypothetical protein